MAFDPFTQSPFYTNGNYYAPGGNRFKTYLDQLTNPLGRAMYGMPGWNEGRPEQDQAYAGFQNTVGGGEASGYRNWLARQQPRLMSNYLQAQAIDPTNNLRFANYLGGADVARDFAADSPYNTGRQNWFYRSRVLG